MPKRGRGGSFRSRGASSNGGGRTFVKQEEVAAKEEPKTNYDDGEEEIVEDESEDEQTTDQYKANSFRPRDISEIQFGAWYEKVPTLPPLTEREVKLENRKKEKKMKKLKKLKMKPKEETEEKLKADVEAQIAALTGKLAQAKLAYETRAAEHFQAKPKKGSKWLNTVLKSGTGADKMAALTVLVQEDPFFSLRHLDTLLALAKKKGRREASMACETLKDLFITNLLPDRKLKFFKDQPLTHPAATTDHLVNWYFEHELKLRYAEFVQTLEVNAKDTVVTQRQQMIKHIYDLLLEKPEQERTLLSLIVNKFGDLEKKISSSIVYQLTNLLQKHPRMKMAVVKEVQPLLYRPNVSLRAQYCAIIFLNQIVLSGREGELASLLLSLYFSLFRRLSGSKDVHTKMLSALLTGISRAFPFAPSNDKNYDEHIDSLFKMVHVTTFNKSVQALLVLLQLLFTQSQPSDGPKPKMTPEQKKIHRERLQSVARRFYRALYAKMLSTELFNSSKQPLFLNILFKAIKLDKSISRAKAFVKRLLQVSVYQKPAFICGALLMLSELIKLQPRLEVLIKFNNEVLAPEVFNSTDQKPEKNKSDPEQDNESLETLDKDLSEDSEEEEQNVQDDEDEEESDESDDSDESEDEDKSDEKEGEQNHESKAKQVEVKEEPADEEDETAKKPEGAWQQHYDPLKREPEYANAGKTCAWELIELQNHFHPSVSKWATMLLEGTPIVYQGNPLQDFTLTAFLDRFSFRNPKQKEREKGGSIMQPLTVPHWVNKPPVNRPEFLQHKGSVRDEEQFFLKYFMQKKDLDRLTGKQKEEDEKKKKKSEFEEDLDSDAEGYDYDNMPLSEDEEEVREDLPSDNEDNDEFYEHLLMQELEAEEQGAFAEQDAEASGDFASLDEFAHILESAGGEEVSAKQKEWEARIKKNKKSKKQGSEDDDDEDGDIFELDDDAEDSASGEEEDAGDFNFASKDGDFYEDEVNTSVSKKRKRPFNIGGSGRGGRPTKVARGGGSRGGGRRGGRGGGRGGRGGRRGGRR